MDKVQQINFIENKIHQSNFKLTPQRQAIIAVIYKRVNEHLSPEEIFALAKKESSEIGLATVYRTLDVLVELNIIDKIVFEDGMARYDLTINDKQHFHHHLLCTQCGSIEEIHEDLLEDVERLVSQQFHFLVTDHRLTFHGVCMNCQRKSKE